MSMINLILISVEHEQCFIISVPALDKQLYNVQNLQQDFHDVLLLQIV